MARIDVTNLDRWVVRFLRGRRYEFRIVFGRDDRAGQRALDLKSSDLHFPDGFYDDVWEQVVQAHGVTSLDEYLGVSRVGRGSRLNRAARARAWRVFEEYRTQLAERGLKEVDDAYRDAAALLQYPVPAASADTQIGQVVAVGVPVGQHVGRTTTLLLRDVSLGSADPWAVAYIVPIQPRPPIP